MSTEPEAVILTRAEIIGEAAGVRARDWIDVLRRVSWVPFSEVYDRAVRAGTPEALEADLLGSSISAPSMPDRRPGRG